MSIAVWTIGRWIPLGNFVPAFHSMLPATLLSNLSTVGTSQLERALDYRRVALFEMATHLTLTFVAVAVAFFVSSDHYVSPASEGVR